MNVSVELGNKSYRILTDQSLDIGISLDFNGSQPNFFGVEKATAIAYENENVVGDTMRGGGCNFQTVHFTPQCNGTHTECVGHIVNENICISDILPDIMIPATVITVSPETDSSSDDFVISESLIQSHWKTDASEFWNALIIRTLPNPPEKKYKTYAPDDIPPYITRDAISYIKSKGTDHVLVDLPSIDRAQDEGKLKGHHEFWDVEQGKHTLNNTNPSQRTITEMIFIPDEISDGSYFLNLQIAGFALDSAPSRPILYPMETL